MVHTLNGIYDTKASIQAVLEQPAFDDGLTYPQGHRHFARGIALVALGRYERAAAELRALRGLVEDPATAAVSIFGLNSGSNVLAVADAVLAGRLAAAQGDIDAAVEHLSRGVELEDALTYNEPPDWHLPVRNELARVLSDAGRLDDAEAAYVADLQKYPGNHWSETGLADLRQRLGR